MKGNTCLPGRYLHFIYAAADKFKNGSAKFVTWSESRALASYSLSPRYKLKFSEAILPRFKKVYVCHTTKSGSPHATYVLLYS